MCLEIVTVDGVEYPLSDYPPNYVETVDLYLGGDVVADLEHHGFTPETCPADLIPLHDGLCLENGQPQDPLVPCIVGVIGDRIGFDANGQPVMWDVGERKGDALAVMNAYAWALTFAKSRWYIRFEAFQGSSWQHEVSFSFTDPDDHQRFVAEMTRFFNAEGAVS